MRVSLFYNKDAGSGISADEVQRQLQRAGHEVIRSVLRGSRDAQMLDQGVDVVVAAGGDGTIAAAAAALAHSHVPLAILPLGTANNIARSLGIEAPLPELIESWTHATAIPFDLGTASGRRGDVTFVEGVGSGLIPAGIVTANDSGDEEHPDTDARVDAALAHFRDALLRLKASRFTVAADGVDISGDYLVVEVLNIPSVGPNIILAPGVTPSDGRFSVVTAGEEHRGALRSYLEDRIAGRPAALSLPAVPAAHVTLGGPGMFHLDDKTHVAADIGTLSLQIRPAVVRVLTNAAG